MSVNNKNMPFNTFAPNTVAKSNEVNQNFNSAVHITDPQVVENKINILTLSTSSDASTITFNLDTANVHSVVLGGNRTLALSNDNTGQPFVLRLIQDGTGGRTVVWWSGIKWVGGVVPTLTTGANKIDVFGFLKTGAGTYDGYIVGMGLA